VQSKFEIGKMERGEQLPSLEILFKLMQVFHVSCDQLLMDDREVDERGQNFGLTAPEGVAA